MKVYRLVSLSAIATLMLPALLPEPPGPPLPASSPRGPAPPGVPGEPSSFLPGRHDPLGAAGPPFGLPMPAGGGEGPSAPVTPGFGGVVLQFVVQVMVLCCGNGRASLIFHEALCSLGRVFCCGCCAA